MPEEVPEGEQKTSVVVAVTDISFMNEPLWLGWRRWTWVRVAFAFVVMMGAFGLWRVERNGDADRDREQAAQEARDAEQSQAGINESYQACLRSNDTRGVIREIVTLATEPSGLDLTLVPGFNDLDPATQQFFRNLRDASAGDNNNDDPDSFRQRAYLLLAERDCEAEFPDHS